MFFAEVLRHLQKRADSVGNPRPSLRGCSAFEADANVFANMLAIIGAAGGSVEDTIKVEIYLHDSSDRNAVNEEWLRMFPDPESRPARHVRPLPPDSPSLVHCEFIAVVEDVP
nr:RidA family protein [Mesorhizobium silamurunense]